MLLVVRLLGPMIYSDPVDRARTRCASSASGSTWSTDVLAAHEEIRGAVEYHHSEGLVESRDRRDAGRRAGPGRADGRRRDGPPHARSSCSTSTCRRARSSTEALESPLHPPAALSRRAGEHRRRAARQGPAARAIAAAGGRIDSSTSPRSPREPWFIPETTNLKDQLNAFLKRRTHFALVVDEYGALQGLVTLEDILEEIVGEIEDEHDAADRGRAPRSPTAR